MKADPLHDRLYMIVGGSTFVGQTLSTFASRTATGPLLTSAHGEKYLRFEQWIDAERTPGWTTFLLDIQNILDDFDFDDRGFIYLAYSIYGLGIIDFEFEKVAQSLDYSPNHVISFRDGESYFIAISSGTFSGGTQILDVTDPSTPTLVATLPSAFIAAARNAEGKIALVTTSRDLHIHTPSTLRTGSPAIQIVPRTASHTFRDVTTDGSDFFAIEGGAAPKIHILQPAGPAFADTIVPGIAGVNPIGVEYGAGYLSVLGSERPAIYQVAGNVLTLLHDGSYFFNYRDSLFPTYPYVGGVTYLPVHVGGETLLVAAMLGLGDVYSLVSPSPLTVTKAFSPASIQPYGTSTLTVTITNPTPTPVTFSLTDTYPANLVNGSAAPSTTCGGGTITATAGTDSFALNNATVGASTNCTVTVMVTSSLSGTYTNTLNAGAILSADNTNMAPASATLTVGRLAAPVIQKSFGATSAVPGVPFRMTITITNPNSAGAITGVAFTDIYPATLVNATPTNVTNTCGGALLGTAGGTSLSLSGGVVPASQSCTVAIDVLATSPGSVTNILSPGSVTSANANSSAAAAAAITAAAHVPIPTLSEWALLALLGLVSIIAMIRLRT